MLYKMINHNGFLELIRLDSPDEAGVLLLLEEEIERARIRGASVVLNPELAKSRKQATTGNLAFSI